MKKRAVAAKTVVVEKPEPTAIEKIAWARREIEFYLEHELKRCRETKQNFLAAATKSDPADIDLSYLVRRSAEDIFVAGAKELEVLSVTGFFKKAIDAQDGGVQYVMEQLQKEQDTTVARLLECPYRHNSTCAVSNFHQECELRAKTEFWRPGRKGWSAGTVSQILKNLRDWLAAETEVLDAYRTHTV